MKPCLYFFLFGVALFIFGWTTPSPFRAPLTNMAGFIIGSMGYSLYDEYKFRRNKNRY